MTPINTFPQTTLTASFVLPFLYLVAPAFNTTDPVQIDFQTQMWNAIATTINSTYFGNTKGIAAGFLLAHYLTLAQNPNYANAGAMTQQQLGNSFVGWNVRIGMDALEVTPYGQQFVSLCKRCGAGIMTSNTQPVMGGQPVPLPPPPYGYAQTTTNDTSGY